MKPEFKYVDVRERPSDFYLTTGKIVMRQSLITQKELEEMYTTAHQQYAQHHILHDCYEYDPTDDGPECETITRILAKHPFYKPGQEKHDIALWRVLNRTALLLYSQGYDTLRSDMQEVVIKRVAAGFVVRGQA